MVLPTDPEDVNWGTEDWWEDPRVKNLIAENARLLAEVALLKHQAECPLYLAGMGRGCPRCELFVNDLDDLTPEGISQRTIAAPP